MIPMNARDLEEALEMGMDWSLREGYIWAEDKEHCEEYGRMLQADPTKVSARAKKRGKRFLSSLRIIFTILARNSIEIDFSYFICIPRRPIAMSTQKIYLINY